MKRLFCLILIAAVALGGCSSGAKAEKYGTGEAYVERLSRGLCAFVSDVGATVSWRFLADDPDDAEFLLYRDGELIYSSSSDGATCFLDPEGSEGSVYRVDMLENGSVVSSDGCEIMISGKSFEIPLDPPGENYSPNDCSVGDVDGDGIYEIFLKWQPDNARDNSQSGITDNTYIDCLRLGGERLWRIDFGRNIRSGAHYLQFLVADFDLDGRAEMTCKTGDGTVDGLGNVIGDPEADYRNSDGHIITGPEYYTLFDGLTGEALDTVDYWPERGSPSLWGDNYGNRCERYLGAVVYLDGVKPYAVTVRGYYTRLTACAYTVKDKKLVEYWRFDSGFDPENDGYGDGNHNCMSADVDGDGRQELCFGSLCLDDDGTVLWNLNTGHGDAMHLGDFLPNRDGLELWICHEEEPYGASLVDTRDGSVIFRIEGEKDTGRACAGNVWAKNAGAEFWSSASGDVYNGKGKAVGLKRPAVNFLIYWDGDPEREILDGGNESPMTVSKPNADGELETLKTTSRCLSCNSTKATPCLSADIFGDWREELIVRSNDNRSLRIFETAYSTDIRLTTLMHDIQYRAQVAGQNNCYNQPPHPSFYLGSDEPLPARPAVKIVGKD